MSAKVRRVCKMAPVDSTRCVPSGSAVVRSASPSWRSPVPSGRIAKTWADWVAGDGIAARPEQHGPGDPVGCSESWSRVPHQLAKQWSTVPRDARCVTWRRSRPNLSIEKIWQTPVGFSPKGLADARRTTGRDGEPAMARGQCRRDRNWSAAGSFPSVRNTSRRKPVPWIHGWLVGEEDQDHLPAGARDPELRNDARARGRRRGPYSLEAAAIRLDPVEPEGGEAGGTAVEGDGPIVEEAWQPDGQSAGTSDWCVTCRRPPDRRSRRKSCGASSPAVSGPRSMSAILRPSD